MKLMRRTIVMFFVFMMLFVSAYAASNADLMFASMMESMDTFSGGGYNTKAYIRNIGNGGSNVTGTIIFGDERYFFENNYTGNLFINSVYTSEMVKTEWSYNAREARNRALEHIMELYEYSKTRSSDGGPTPVDCYKFNRLNNSGSWHLFGFDSAYMSGTTKTSDYTFKWEILPFYIQQDEIIYNSSVFFYFRVLYSLGNGSTEQVHEYIIGDSEEVSKQVSQLLKLNGNLDDWDQQMLSALANY